MRWRYIGPRPVIVEGHGETRPGEVIESERNYAANPYWEAVIEKPEPAPEPEADEED